jgi:hypothetical protein
MDPESKLLVVIDVGTRTLEMAQCVVHQVWQPLAPDCVPLCLTDGLKDDGTAFLSHFGQWRQPARRCAKGPLPQPRWMPVPQWLYAQVVKSSRRRRIGGVQYRVVFGTIERVAHILAACGWKINTAEFIPLSFWYDTPLTSQYSDRRHDPWQVYGSLRCSPARWSSWISRA